MKIDPSKSQKSPFGSRFKRFFQMNQDGAKADRAIRHAFITGIFITLITGILLVSSHLMQSGIETAIHKYKSVGYEVKLGTVQDADNKEKKILPEGILKNFSPWYYLLLPLSLLLTLGIYKKSRVAAILMFLMLLGDKVLLIGGDVLNVGTGLPIILPVIFLLFQGIRGTFGFHAISKSTSSEAKAGQEKDSKKLLFLDAAILLLIVMLASVIVHQILRWVQGTEVITSLSYWLEDNGLAIDSWRYPVGILIVGLVSVIPLYSYFKKLIGTFQLAVMIVLFIALATFTATNLIPQSGTTPFVLDLDKNPEYFIEAYGIYLDRAIRFLEMDNIFLSIWYCSLYVVLIASLVKVIKRRKFGLKNLGFHLLHISLIVIIGSAWFNYPFSVAGYLNLYVGKQNNIIVHYPQSSKKFFNGNIPRTIRSDRFNNRLLSRVPQKDKDFLLSVYSKDTNNNYLLKKKLKYQKKARIANLLKSVQYRPSRIELEGIPYSSAEKLGFYLFLKSFVTKNWDADYKIYVRKFPKKLPKRISAATFQTMKRVVNQLANNLSNTLNPDDQGIKQRVLSVRDAFKYNKLNVLNFNHSNEKIIYKLENKVVTRPLLSLLSTVGFNFLATQSYDLEIDSNGMNSRKGPRGLIYPSKHYLLNTSALNDRVKEDLAWFFRYFRYKGKDIASHPILTDPDKRKGVDIFTTDVTYSVQDYIPDSDFILVPKRVNKESFEETVLNRITDTKKKEVIKTVYQLGKDSYTLRQELNQPAYQQMLARILETVDQKALHSSVETYKPVARFILKEDDKKPEPYWLQNNEAVTPDPHIQVQMLWEPSPLELKKELRIGVRNEAPHWLSIWKKGQKSKRMEIREGVSYPITGSSYRLTFVKYYNDFRMDRSTKGASNASDQDLNPAVELLLSNNQNDHNSIRFYLFPKDKALQVPILLKQIRDIQRDTGLNFKYDYKGGGKNIKEKYLIAGKERLLYIASDGKAVQKIDLELHHPYKLNTKQSAYLFFTQLISNSSPSFVQSVLKNRENVPEALEFKDYQRVIKKIKSKKPKTIIEESYRPVTYVKKLKDPDAKARYKNSIKYVLKSQYYYDKKKRQVLGDLFNSINFKQIPSNPIVWLEISGFAPDRIDQESMDKQIISKLSLQNQKDLMLSSYVKIKNTYRLKPSLSDSDKSDVASILKSLNYRQIITLADSKQRGANNHFLIPNSDYTLTLESRPDKQTKHWKSYLSVLEKDKDKDQLVIKDGKPVIKAEGVVQLNQPMYYGGYWFYQTHARVEDPDYSGIGVNREPALSVLYTAFVTLALGVLLMFYWKPKAKKKPVKESKS